MPHRTQEQVDAMLFILYMVMMPVFYLWFLMVYMNWQPNTYVFATSEVLEVVGHIFTYQIMNILHTRMMFHVQCSHSYTILCFSLDTECMISKCMANSFLIFYDKLGIHIEQFAVNPTVSMSLLISIIQGHLSLKLRLHWIVM